jgi:hypothetical protein
MSPAFSLVNSSSHKVLYLFKNILSFLSCCSTSNTLPIPTYLQTAQTSLPFITLPSPFFELQLALATITVIAHFIHTSPFLFLHLHNENLISLMARLISEFYSFLPTLIMDHVLHKHVLIKRRDLMPHLNIFCRYPILLKTKNLGIRMPKLDSGLITFKGFLCKLYR